MADVLCERSYSTHFQAPSVTICMNVKGCSALNSRKEDIISKDKMSNASICHIVNKRTQRSSIHTHIHADILSVNQQQCIASI